ncbi:redoxin family protein [Pedobacter sp. Du54]|uniref:TlpA family protein disulfide reductase n=1 Tax=Pedobacter anseongensis TaxID=3133439 RepID=UPI0030B440D5
MKFYFLTALIAVCSTFVYAQNAIVNLNLIGATEKKVMVVLPIKNGEKFWGNKVEKTLDETDKLTLNFNVNKIGFVQIANDGNYFKFYIEPGISDITINLTKKAPEQVVVSGKNSEGLVLINAKSRAFYQSNAMAYYRADSTVAGITAKMDSNHVKALKPYQALLSAQKITPTFYQYVKNDIDQYYTAMLAHIPTELYLDAIRAKTFRIKDEFAALWTKVYQEHPIENMNLASTAEFYDYAQYYASTYKKYYEARLKGTYIEVKIANETAYLKESYTNFTQQFNGKMKEYMLANFLYNEMFQNKYQLVLTELYQQFIKTYPQSGYASYLFPMYDKIIKYHEVVKKDFTPEQKLMTDYSHINSLDELAALFKGKTVFVDIWATWCGPCKAEFEYGEELDKFLKSKNAEMLYISMDKPEVEQQWKDMIKYYKLAGNHIRTNELLQKDLINRLWEGKGYAIPRYLILKDGKLAVADALRPSDKRKLYEQIANFL